MHILYDHQVFSEQTYGGISRLYAELIAGINDTPEDQAQLALFFSNNEYLREKGMNVPTFLPNLAFPKKIQILYRLNKLASELALWRGSFDVFHATNYNPYFIPRLKGKPFVITFYDMIHERFAGQYKELGDVSEIITHKKILAERANCIIAISESTKRDVVELLQIDPDRIRVVYLGSSLQNTPLPTSSDVDKPYLLYVGKRDAYKNFPLFLKAVSPLLKQHQLLLICAGGGQFAPDEQVLIESLGLQQHVRQQFIDTDQTLQRLYASAQAFVFPSLYEGFGIPVLEAFSCGCPCILSNSSSLPEVAAEAAVYFDPTDQRSIEEAVERVISDAAFRNQLSVSGRERLLKFSWRQTITETLATYATCL